MNDDEDDDGDGLPMPFSEVLTGMAFGLPETQTVRAVFE